MSQNAKLIIERIKQSLHISNDKALCQLLDIKQNTLSTWKKRDTLDFNKIISFCEENNLDLNEIFFNDILTGDEIGSENDVGFVGSVPITHSIEEKPVKIEKFKKVNLVNTNKEISFFRIEPTEPEKNSELKIAIGQRLQLKKMKEEQEVILILKNKQVTIDKIEKITDDFSQIQFEPINSYNTLPFVALKEIKHAYILIGFLEDNELKNDKQGEVDKLNQVLLLEKQIERLKKKFA